MRPYAKTGIPCSVSHKNPSDVEMKPGLKVKVLKAVVIKETREMCNLTKFKKTLFLKYILANLPTF